IAEVLGVAPGRPDLDAPRVSGSLKAHYAPRTPLQVLPLKQLLDVASQGALDRSPGRTAALVFSPDQLGDMPGVDWLPCASEPVSYARDLYALLRRLDGQGYDRILMEQPPQDADWQAINDRIGRASAAFS